MKFENNVNIKKFLDCYNKTVYINYKGNKENIYLDIVKYILDNSNKIKNNKEEKLKQVSDFILFCIDMSTKNKIPTINANKKSIIIESDLAIRIGQLFFEVAIASDFRKYKNFALKQGLTQEQVSENIKKIYKNLFIYLQIIEVNKKDYKEGTIESKEPTICKKIRRIVLDILMTDGKKSSYNKLKQLNTLSYALDEFFDYKFPYYQINESMAKHNMQTMKKLFNIIEKDYKICKQKDAEKYLKMLVELDKQKQVVENYVKK